jgi:hypothetical protein
LSQQSPVGHGLLIHGVSRSHTLTQEVGMTSLDEWSARHRDLYLKTNTQHSQQTDIHSPGGIRTPNLSSRAAVYLLLRPRGHWDRQVCFLWAQK